MIPAVVVVAVLIYFVLKATGLFDELVRLGRDFDRERSLWSQRKKEWMEEDPERLKVYKDFFEDWGPDDDQE